MSKKKMPEHVAQAAIGRSEGTCEVMNPFTCTGQAEALHHRKISGREHSIENCVHICKPCHDWIHANPTESYRQGWLVKMNHDPAETPMSRRGRVVLLDGEGGFEINEEGG